jgi:hypothetical protein
MERRLQFIEQLINLEGEGVMKDVLGVGALMFGCRETA